MPTNDSTIDGKRIGKDSCVKIDCFEWDNAKKVDGREMVNVCKMQYKITLFKKIEIQMLWTV